MKKANERVGTGGLLAIIALATTMTVIILGVRSPLTLAGALTMEDGDVVSITADMDGDGNANTTETTSTEGTGEVRIHATAVGGGDGVIIGAPGAGLDGHGEAYVFFGPFEIPPGETELILTADDADLFFASWWAEDTDFGRRAAPLYDVTGDGQPEFRVQSVYTHTDSSEYVVTQVYRSEPTAGFPDGGEPLFAVVHHVGSGDLWTTLQGDALGDQAVTANDLFQVVMNYVLKVIQDLPPSLKHLCGMP